MKSLMLHVHDDDGLEARFQVALDLARTFDAHLTCLQVSPLAGYVAMDALGGGLVGMEVLERAREQEGISRERLEARLTQEDVRWDWATAEGDVVQAIVRASALADLLVVGQFPEDGGARQGMLAIVDDICVQAACPVVVVPPSCSRFEIDRPMVVGWNGSTQAAHAVRHAAPLLARSSAVHIVSVGLDAESFPQTDASSYCARHGIATTLQQLPGSASHAGEAIASYAGGIGAGLIVMGAFGRSRLREMILGGTTRALLDGSAIPLLLSH